MILGVNEWLEDQNMLLENEWKSQIHGLVLAGARARAHRPWWLPSRFDFKMTSKEFSLGDKLNAVLIPSGQ